MGKIPKVLLGNETHVKTVDLRLSLFFSAAPSCNHFPSGGSGEPENYLWSIQIQRYPDTDYSTVSLWSFLSLSFISLSLFLSLSFSCLPTTKLLQRVPLSLQLSGGHTLILLQSTVYTLHG